MAFCKVLTKKSRSIGFLTNANPVAPQGVPRWVGMRCHQEHGRRGPKRGHFLHELEARLAGHEEVCDEHVVRRLPEPSERFLTR